MSNFNSLAITDEEFTYIKIHLVSDSLHFSTENHEKRTPEIS